MPIDEFIITVFCWVEKEFGNVTEGVKLRARGFAPKLSDSEVITIFSNCCKSPLFKSSLPANTLRDHIYTSTKYGLYLAPLEPPRNTDHETERIG